MSKHFSVQISVQEVDEATPDSEDRYGKLIKGSPRTVRDRLKLTASEDSYHAAVRKLAAYVDPEVQQNAPSKPSSGLKDPFE